MRKTLVFYTATKISFFHGRMVEKQRKNEWPMEKQGPFPFLFLDLETKKVFPLFFHCLSMEKWKPSYSVTLQI